MRRCSLCAKTAAALFMGVCAKCSGFGAPADSGLATLVANAKRKPGAPVIAPPRNPRKQKGSA